MHIYLYKYKTRITVSGTPMEAVRKRNAEEILFRRDELTWGWEKLNFEEFHNLHPSPDIIRIIKSRLRWAGRVACMEPCGILENPKGKEHWENLGIDGRIALKRILENGRKPRIGFI
jgi:hypothetical protein